MTFTIDTLLETTDLSTSVRREVPRLMNQMLGQTFLYQDRDTDKDDYYMMNRHRPVFEALFAVIGFKLLHDDYHRIFQVISDFSACRQRFKLDESLMIVVLRKLYEEQVEHLSLASDPVVTIGEVREEYRTITGKERDLGMGQYEAILRNLKRLGLVEGVNSRTLNVRDSEARIRLRGSVRMLLPVQTAEEMEAWLRRYRVQEAMDEEEPEDEEMMSEK
ncbi:MAG: DUF4194 domain-containing protein [Anaerolineae bacterium]|nr:DUF4194 domain-containing protein [Anaerolineae bacterium]